MDYFIRHRKKNGLSKYVRKPHAHLLLIHVKGFEEWINSKKDK